MADDLDLQDMLTNPAWARWLNSLRKFEDEIKDVLVAQSRNDGLDEIRHTSGRLTSIREILRAAEKLHATD